MKNQPFKLQTGETFELAVPERYDEFDFLPGGRVGLCLECGIDDVVYRGAQADVRDQLAAAVAAKYPEVQRRTKPHTNPERAKKGDVVFDESPIKFLSRVAATIEGLSEEAPFQDLVDEIMAKNATLDAKDDAKIAFSVEKVARTGSGGLVGKGDLDMAAQYIAQGPDALDVTLSKLQQVLQLPELIVLPTDPAAAQKTLALKLKDLRAMLAKQTFASLKA